MPISRAAPERSAAPRLQPDRFPRAPRVRDDARVRPGRGLPRPRRQPRLPLGQQLLLASRSKATRSRSEQWRPPRPARGGSDRRPVHRERRRKAPRRVDRARSSRSVAVRRDRPEADGLSFGNGGIEIDHRRDSPRGTAYWPRSRTSSGPGFTGQMTYYETAAGARAFAAGAFTLAGAREPRSAASLANLWRSSPPRR